ncbi:MULTISPECIES: S41 family peptidase [unclassified Marinimicrobium]|jgi:carboxyl-terminal processing protease|uniref:S41 family peptidase n=1 Tax=unclassified Marinimicrobium TaxID=2632100 RepID=UPI000466E11B|nr:MULTISPECIES: S41 family peptidase [unclassified Marinimicrobium]
MLYANFKQAALAVLFATLSPLALAQSVTDTATPEEQGLLPLEELRTFTRVYDHIRNGYVEELSDAELLEYAIKGMIAELDPHSAYLDEKSFEDLQENTSGEFGGIGIEVGMEDGFVKVIAPIDDTPAQKAGIEPGDLIIRLDDQPVKGLSLNEAVEKMRGPKGSDLTLTVVREGIDQPFEVTLTRDIIKVRSVRVRVEDDHYAYIRIAQFQVSTGQDMIDALEDLRAEHDDIRGIVLDLRNNPGGVLQTSVEVADAFLNEGLVVYTEGRTENSDMRYYANEGEVAEDLPIVVLINDGSASASEIVAGALQDHGRAVVLGTRSFGKGSVQTVVPISETRAVKLTTALYYTPNGRSIQAQGIVPDVTVERARVTALRTGVRSTEADLAGHLGNANGGEESNTRTRKSEREARDDDIGDNQLHEAINMLKGLHIFQQRQKANLAQRLPPLSDSDNAPEHESGAE